MDAERFARNVTDALARSAALKSPEAARERFRMHMISWWKDVEERFNFYTHAVEEALPTLRPDDADIVRRIWEGQTQYRQTTTDAERHEIDTWLKPLSEALVPDGHQSWVDVLMDCEGGYFTEAIDDELRELAAVPGFDDVPIRDWEPDGH